MRDYPFNPEQLFNFSETIPYLKADPLLQHLDALKSKYHFPAIRNDIGSFLSWLATLIAAKNVFEFGSGYGHSAFWFLQNPALEQIILTEKRTDLEDEFLQLPWPTEWKKKMHYYQGDAFATLQKVNQKWDMVLVDGVKADYQRFIETVIPFLNKNAIIAIDNSYWRGSFLDNQLVQTKQSAMKIKELHNFIAQSQQFRSLFLPYPDGLSVLQFIN